ncbi:pseudouridine-5'-phosphate glycosidase [Tistlia consotensis]|uniref:Pseudouridine-5'-phosphate glycosidase n=1 Tax=Tistlia consotensis USBA 355 TaxID=560819 RepID=A0A1Y6CHJ6_9PROT|nr:pseudouridine-5'-phosphate glycosidase [Tistlia consotensis]SMF53590.1 pseudouridine-5'-phosphate glycosidase [Tistlia consotensis USBA 355]SNR85720.1 pseudouridine-5'-phosphate glycosidase [Tistlia consotensis]
MSASFIDESDEVAAARAEGRPLVALESTVVAHGLPWPDNLHAAEAIEAAVREAGAVPATIALADGRLRIGLDRDTLERLARGAAPVAKVSRRDFGAVLASRGLGATTVAGTMAAAALARIRVMATGGLGGVHRGAEASFDISADLGELARTPVAVVCSGAKSILDLPKTLELLETLGVPLIGYGCGRLPAFYLRETEHPVPARADSPAEAAAILEAQWSLGLGGGALLANPIPAAAALDPARFAAWLAEAEREAALQEVTGKAVTPFLLSRLHALSEGATLAANRVLLIENARLAGRIAAALAGGG